MNAVRTVSFLSNGLISVNNLIHYAFLLVFIIILNRITAYQITIHGYNARMLLAEHAANHGLAPLIGLLADVLLAHFSVDVSKGLKSLRE